MATPTEIHRAYLDSVNTRNWELLRSLLHPEFSYTGPDGQEVTGGPEVAVGVVQMFVTGFDAHLANPTYYGAGEVSIAELQGGGTHVGEFMGIAPTGKTIFSKICDVIEIRDGKIYR